MDMGSSPRPPHLQSLLLCGRISCLHQGRSIRRPRGLVGRALAPRGGEALCAACPSRQARRHLALRVALLLVNCKAELPDIKLLALFGFGTTILRGAACTVNDLLDRDIDKKVERTKSRPIASGALTPAQGFYFLVFQVLLWFGFLLQLNKRSLIMGASWLVLFFSYPLMKRLIHWPQAFLGFTVSCGVFIGSAAIKESLDYAVLLPMYFAGICWTLVYDTIYAHQDKKDDFKAGVKSTAITFGDNTKYWLSGFGAACITSLALTGYNAHLGSYQTSGSEHSYLVEFYLGPCKMIKEIV
ncbi:hypothetical protein PVAP13_4NG219900 [Panicum virgatum]|uniref:Uncharacterized protein n=1 Tax=Panicum virgatum TaxID=38727 RepID=A0A8T0TCF6_PANVG|nr:hypothetical protein PVAP13_4NG219900 [Panicum virgatum]